MLETELTTTIREKEEIKKWNNLWVDFKTWRPPLNNANEEALYYFKRKKFPKQSEEQNNMDMKYTPLFGEVP